MSNNSEWGKALSASNQNNKLSWSGVSSDTNEVKSIDPLSYMENARKGIGLLDRLKLDWRNSKAMVEQVEGIATSLMVAQRKSIENQIMLDLDIDQKRRYAIYREEAKELEKQIFISTEEVKKELIKYMKSQWKDMFKEKNQDIREFEAMVESGDLTREDADLLSRSSEKWTLQNKDNIEMKLKMLLEQHGETYIETLRLLKSKL